jgi:hypothetical protein
VATPLGIAGSGPEEARVALDVGSVISRTFRIWLNTLLPFLLVALLVHSPLFIGLGAFALADPGTRLEGWSGTLIHLSENLLDAFLTAAITYGVFRSLRGGEEARIGEILRNGLSRLGTVWFTWLVLGIGTLLGFCALVVPGLVLIARWYVAIPVAVIENPGATAALSRSGELTEGNRWRTFALSLVMGFIAALATAAITALVEVAVGRSWTADADSAGLLMVERLLLLPFGVLGAIPPAIAYHDLRVAKEGADIEELLSVFE